jgi:hypothetical protein
VVVEEGEDAGILKYYAALYIRIASPGVIIFIWNNAVG